MVWNGNITVRRSTPNWEGKVDEWISDAFAPGQINKAAAELR